MQQGPGELWIIGGGVADSATPQITLHTDGTVDATLHPASFHFGSVEDGYAWKSVPKMEDIRADQFDGPLDRYVTEQEAGIEATLTQIDPAIIQKCSPYTAYAAGSGYKQVTGGGNLSLSSVCVALVVPKRTSAYHYIAVLFKAHGTIGLEANFGRAKKSVFKASFKALTDPTRTAGRQMFCFYETVAAE